MAVHSKEIEELVAEYRKLAFQDPGRMLYVDEDGNPCINYHNLDEKQKAAVSGFEFDKDDRLKLKFGDKQRALDSLARIYGAFEDNTNLKVEEDLLKRLSYANNRIKPTE